MPSQIEIITACLAGRCYLYNLLSRLFGDAPTSELLSAVAGGHTVDALKLVLGQEQTLQTLPLLFDLYKALSNDTQGVLSRLEDEYTRLLIGPGQLPAPPWESVYLQKGDTLFQENTLQVRRAYMKYNLRPVHYPHVADDHIALELDFMAILSGLLRDCFEQQRHDEAERLRIDQEAFLERHLLGWVPSFAERLRSAAEGLLYPKAALLTCQVLEADASMLGELETFLKPGLPSD